MNSLKLTAGILLASCATHVIAASKEKRPNIIVLMTDDQTYHSIAALGTSQVKTPHLDQLVHNGVSFVNHYATTSISMCSRACLMTGMYEYKTGCNFMHGPLSTDKFEKSYPVLLRQHGYYTGFGGKMGFATTDDQCANDSYHSYDVMPIDKFDSWAGGIGQTDYETAKNKYLKQYAEKYPHSSRAYGAYACDFIDEALATRQPFCLSLFFKSAHVPLNPDPFFDDAYRDTHFEKVPNYGRDKGQHLCKQSHLGRQFLYMFDEKVTTKYQQATKAYHQLIYGVDYAIGMILDKLKAEGIDDNTLIIFTSDNGWVLGSHGYGGKVLPYEEASRVPLIVYDPKAGKASRGAIAQTVAGNIDITATVLDYAGIEKPANMDGISFKKVVKNPSCSHRESLPLIQDWGTAQTFAFSVVVDGWKYIYWPFGDKMEPAEELFDMTNDREELHNVVHYPSNKMVLEKLRMIYDKQLQHWKENCVETGDYKAIATIMDRHIPWAEKAHLMPQRFYDNYNATVDRMKQVFGYEGPNDDYDAIIEYLNQHKGGTLGKYKKASKKRNLTEE